MSDTVKLIIEIPKEDFKKLVNPYQHNEIWCNRLKRMVMHGIPLDDVKAEIKPEIERAIGEFPTEVVFSIIDNHIGKAESEGK